MVSTNERSILRLLPPRLGAVLGAACLLALASLGALAQDETGPPEIDTSRGGPVFRLVLDSAVHPVAVERLDDALEQAEQAGAAALVIELSTPGGLEVSMRTMLQSILGSPVPVVVYVSPTGARAASAGFFLLMAADVAAMAPSTNTGAAAVVGAGGQEVEGTMGKKVQEDAAATIRSLAARNGRNVEAAESAVLEAKSFSAEEALEQELIDLIAPDLTALLAEIDGREIERAGDTVTLATAGASVRTVEPSFTQRVLGFLADPNVAYLLLTLGGLALYLEIMNPGTIIPGVVGVLSLILAFFGLSVLPTNVVGVALILLAIGLFIAEIKVQSFGILTLAGIVALVFGSLMLFKTAIPALRVSVELIVAVALAAGMMVAMLALVVLKTYGSRVTTGQEGLVTERGVARSPLAPSGKVFVHGELWDATSREPIAPGEPVEVVAVQGLKLEVRPVRGDETLPEANRA